LTCCVPNLNPEDLIIVGDSFVGKSNILLKWTKNKFKTDHEITIGVEFGARNIKIDDNKKIFRIQVWDTAGQETFRSITRAYYKNSVCAFLVYDITNKESFKNISSWYEECKAQSPKTVLLILIGNKVDLADKREVTFDEGKDFATKNNMMFFETSAKTHYNIDEVFTRSAEEIWKNISQKTFYDLSNENCGIKQNLNTSNSTIRLSLDSKNDEKNKKSGCC